MKYYSKRHNKLFKKKSKKIKRNKKTHKKRKGNCKKGGSTKRSNEEKNTDDTNYKKRRGELSPNSVTHNVSPPNVPNVANIDTLVSGMKVLTLKPPSENALAKVQEEKDILKRKKEVEDFKRKQIAEKAQKVYEQRIKEMQEYRKKQLEVIKKEDAAKREYERQKRAFDKHKMEEAQLAKEKEIITQKDMLENIKNKKYLDPEDPRLGKPAHPYGQTITTYTDDYGDGIIFGGKKKKMLYL